MGYDISQGTTRFHIAADQVARAYQLAATLRSPDALADAQGGVMSGGQDLARWYAFVNPQELDEARDLPSFLSAFRWRPTVAADGAVTGLTFTGSRADQSGLLFEAIGSCVFCGSFIEMAGEDGAMWRWVFDGTSCRLDIITPSEWGPSWLQSACVTDASEPSDTSPDESWLGNSEAWRG